MNNHVPTEIEPPLGVVGRIRKALFGPARDVRDPSIHHKISLIAFLAWVGLGADGLSSSAYGPEEGFRALGEHRYLAIFLVIATAVTVFVISFAYSRIIEHFPAGGGGYLVASKLLGRPAGVVSGCALLVDYILTITVSIAGGGDAIFSLLPLHLHVYKLPLEFAAIFLLIIMNLRGVKESVTALIPIFLVFVFSHALLIGGGILFHLMDAPAVAHNVRVGLSNGAAQIGAWGLFVVFIRAYSMGGGTYTGIEAVSNGLGILREPRVETGKRTMTYMAISLAATAGGLLLCYMLANVQPLPGQTLNTVLARTLTGHIHSGDFPIGPAFVWITIMSEAVLLLVASQTGFIDGPRVMSNMAIDEWLPRRFAALSDRLTMQNGIIVMGVAAMATLAYTRGHIGILVIMYSINVFLTFSLSELGMVRHWIGDGRKQKKWKRNLSLHGVGLVLCVSILSVMVVEKLTEGGWITLLVTVCCIAVCAAIHRHYRTIARRLREVDRIFMNLPKRLATDRAPPRLDPAKPTAIILVGRYGGLGIHILLTVVRLFSETFHNVIFVSVGMVDSSFFREGGHVAEVEERTRAALERYVELAHGMGKPARSAYRVGTDVVQECTDLCVELSKEFSRPVVFAGTLVFDRPHWYDRLLHNETAYAIQRQIKFSGLPTVILPMLVSRNAKADAQAMASRVG